MKVKEAYKIISEKHSVTLLDPSARPLVPGNELTFTIPMSRFKEMLDTMNDSALYQKAFSALKRRINK